jgi:hypothetical protein
MSNIYQYLFPLQTLSHHDVFQDEFTMYKTIRKKFMIWDLMLPHFCVCPKPGPGFPTSYIVFADTITS